MSTTQDTSARFTITYKTVNKDTQIKFDIYPPTNFTQGKALPCVVHFHGGGFAVGSRRDFLPSWLKERLSKSGIAFVSADYRLLPTGGVTGHQILEDVQDLFAFLRSPQLPVAIDALASEGCPKFTLDPEKIAVTGGSAGGMLAYLSAVHVRPRPVAVLSLFSMGGDLLAPHYLSPKSKPFLTGRPLVDPSNFTAFIHPNSTSNPEVLAESPLAFNPPATPGGPPTPANPRMAVALLYLQLGTYLDYYTGEHEPSLSKILQDASAKGASRENLCSLIPGRHRPLFPELYIDEHFPPTFLLHGTADTAVPPQESERIYQLLKKAGGKAGEESTIRRPEGQEHFFDILVPNVEDKFGYKFDEAAEFLKKYL
ncbi:alpha/beta-hydrolase, partial [Dendrothele bispora CBS 962.96]